MKKIFAVFLFGTFLLVSCKNAKHSTILQLHGENMMAEMPFMKVPIRIMILGNNMYIEDLVPLDSGRYHCHVLSYPDLTYIKSVGQRGGGPDEIGLITPMQAYQDKLTLFDGNKGHLFKYDSRTNIEERVGFKMDGITLDYACINDTAIITGDITGQNRLVSVTPSTRKGLFEIPQSLSDKDNPYNANIWRGYISYNQRLNKVAMATQYGRILEIYDLNDMSSKVVGDIKHAPSSKKKTKDGFADIKWVNDDIYVLLSPEKSSSTMKSVLYRFNQDGLLLQKYQLDQILESFCIDERNNLLWGLRKGDDNAIYRFEMK